MCYMYTHVQSVDDPFQANDKADAVSNSVSKPFTMRSSVLNSAAIFDTQDLTMPITPGMRRQASEVGRALSLSPWNRGKGEPSGDDDSVTEPESPEHRVPTQLSFTSAE